MSVAATALRNAVYWALVISVLPMRNGYATEPTPFGCSGSMYRVSAGFPALPMGTVPIVIACALLVAAQIETMMTARDKQRSIIRFRRNANGAADVTSHNEIGSGTLRNVISPVEYRF